MTLDPVLSRTLRAARLPASGAFTARGGWVSRAWVGDEYVVRMADGSGGPYRHEAAVVGLIEGGDVPHAAHIAHGDGPDGPWYVSRRLSGGTLHDAWTSADDGTRQSVIESLGTALRALHRVPVPAGLKPPWLVDALAGGSWPAYHPPIVGAAAQLVSDLPTRDQGLLDDVGAWVGERSALFAADVPVLVHGDLHGSNVIVDHGRVTGLIDFAEAVAQPADVELDTILRWCARPLEFPPTPSAQGLDVGSLAPVPEWLHGVYPELFARPHLRERLEFHDMWVELAIAAHHPEPSVREVSMGRVAGLLDGHSHLDGLVW